MKNLKTFEEHSKHFRIIDDIDEFESFINEYDDEILSQVKGHSDGWNQKMTALNKILNREKVEISDEIREHPKYEDIINNI